MENLKDQYSPAILKQIIGRYFYPRDATATWSNPADVVVYPVGSKICQLIGEQLLSVTSSFDLNDFLDVWKATVPSGLRPKLRKHLTCAGRAFCPASGSSSLDLNLGLAKTTRANRRYPLFRTISLLRSEDLPDDSVESRLQALFERCSSWPEPELASFLTDLVVPPNIKCEHHSDSVVGTLSFPISTSDSDFEYSDEIETEFSGCTAVPGDDGDSPRQASATVVTILNRLCRATTTADQGRVYTPKYANC
ncbi:hypothetical protein FBUS_11754 [Fasciolopsis buskii]|uniref:Sister chromatid cohesion protein DCC1 n=1 Tax=Fasciolopsis buskii TaxID=27845 RepID=A0A8E0VPR5_9TREM|nr:hypothetical protein FBUS_11754 [Fasciolopsis buski]